MCCLVIIGLLVDNYSAYSLITVNMICLLFFWCECNYILDSNSYEMQFVFSRLPRVCWYTFEGMHKYCWCWEECKTTV